MTRVFTTGQVARIFSVNINTVIKWFDEDKLDGFRLPRSNERRIYRESVEQFMTEHDISPELLRAFDEEQSNKKRGRGRRKRARKSKQTGPEQRTFPRKPVDLDATLQADGLEADVQVRNLSMGGVFVTGFSSGDKRIPEEFRLHIGDGDDTTLDGRCQLVHVRRNDDQTLSLGCRFTQIDPGTLQSYLARL